MSRPASARRAAPRPGPGDARPGRHLRVVEEPRSRHTLRYALLAIVIVGAAVFGAVSLNALAAGQAVRAEQLQTRVVEAERTHGQLVAAVARLEDPDRIRRAAGELGLVPAPTRRYLTTDETLPGDAARGRAVQPGEAADPLKPVLSVQR